MASIQQVQQLRVTGTHESDVAQGAAKDAAALRDMANAADQAAAAGERLGQKARVTNEELRRSSPTLDAINRKVDENGRLASETARANAVYRRSVDELRAAQQQGLLTAEQVAEKERRLAIIRDSAIERATILADRMRQQFTVAGVANQNMADSTAAALAKYRLHNQEVDKGTAGMGRFSQVVGQGGMQLQDLVVQLGAGTSAFVAIGQQLPQFLGIFGPGGAIAGAVVAVAAVAANLLTMGDSASKAADETSALDKVLGSLTRSIDDQAGSLKDLIAKYNEAGAAQQVLSRLKLSASLVETTEKLEKQKQAFDDLVQSALAAQEFTTTAGAVPISAASVVKFGRPDFDIQQSPALADDPVIKLGLQLRELMSSGDFVGATDLISKFGKAGEEAGRGLINTASSITELTRQQTQARTFLSLVEQGLVKNFRAANDAGRSAGDYGDALAGLAGERAWIEAAEQGEEALRHLAREQAVLAAQTKVEAAANKLAYADLIRTDEEYAEVLRLTAEAGELAGKRFDLETLRKGAFGLKDITKATADFGDKIEDANRFLAEQAGGLTEAERVYRPFAAQIEKMNDLLGQKGISDKQRVDIQQTINRLELAGAVAMETANDKLERQIALRREEIDQLVQRNSILSRVAAGGDDARQAQVELERFDVKVRIDSSVERFADSMRDVNGALSDTAKMEVARYKALLLENAELNEQIKVSSIARSAVGAATDTLSAIMAGDWATAAQGIDDFMADFTDLTDLTGDAAKGFAALGKSLLDSAEAGMALGNILGEAVFGKRSEHQQRNAQIGSTVATTVGDFFGVPKGISSFVGNVLGGLFGPGKSDSTASAEIWNSTGRIKTTDTSPSKQDAGNMSARDSLAESIRTFADLLTKATGGSVVDKVDVHVGSRDGNTWSTGYETGRTAVGDIEGTLSQVLAAITNTLTGVDQQLKDRLTGIDFSNLERAESDVNFVLNYANAIKALNGELEGGEDAVSGARQAVIDLGSYVRDFRDQAGRLGYNAAETASALRASVERFAGIADAAPVMTEMETQVAALAASFSVLGPVLESVGYSAEEAAAAVQTAQNRQMAVLRASVSGAQDARYNDLIGNSFINDIRSLIETRDIDIREALAVGLSDSGAIRNFQAALAGVLTTDLRTDQLQEALRLFGDMPDVVTAANAALTAMNNGLDDTAKAARSAADIANERAGLEVRLLQAQGDTVALRERERNALDESNRAIYDQVTALEDQRQATEAAAAAAMASANITRTLEERVLAIATNGTYDASIKMLEKRQQLEFLAAQTSGYAADQLRILADVLAGEMVLAVDALNRETIARSENLTIRALRAQAANEGLSEATRDALSAQALQIERNRELAEAISDEERAVLRVIYAYEDQASAAAKAATATQAAADSLDRLRGQGGSIRAWVDQARAGGIEGYLSPAEQLANAGADFQRQLALAAANDNDALSSITQYAERYAQAQQAYAGSGGQTQSTIADILASLEGLPAVKSFDQQQLDQLQIIAANTTSMAAALAAADLDGDTRITWPEFSAWSDNNLTVTGRIASILGVQSGSLEDIFTAIDVNGDGVIDAVERSRLGVAEAIAGLPAPTATQIGAALSPYFTTLDRNLDGLLTPDEFRSGLVGLASDANITSWFRELDANGDGVLSATELTRRAVVDLGSGSGAGTLLAIGQLIYAGNVDRLNLGGATNQGLITLGTLIGAGNSYLQAIRDKSWSVSVNGGGGAPAPSYDPPPYAGGQDAARDTAYLNRYPDVAAAIGNYASPYEHYMAYGRFEGRSYATGTDGHVGGPALVHARELLLPDLDRGAKVLTARETAEMFRPVNINMPAAPAGGGWREVVQAVRQLEIGQREQTATAKRLEAMQVQIARAQAQQQSGEMKEQTGVLRTIAGNTAPRRASMG